MECSRGLTESNLITVLMRSNHMAMQQATDHVGFICEKLVQQMLEGETTIRSFSDELDAQLKTYFIALEKMVVGNINWSFRSKRYFGDEGERIMNDRVVTIGHCNMVTAAG